PNARPSRSRSSTRRAARGQRLLQDLLGQLQALLQWLQYTLHTSLDTTPRHCRASGTGPSDCTAVRAQGQFQIDTALVCLPRRDTDHHNSPALGLSAPQTRRASWSPLDRHIPTPLRWVAAECSRCYLKPLIKRNLYYQ